MRLSTLTLAELSGLACPYCGQTTAADTPWARTAAARWGWCGVRLVIEQETAGVLLVSPLPEDPRQAMVMWAWVAPDHVSAGYGRQLVQSMAARLDERRVRTLIAQGSHLTPRCTAPHRDFLRAVGFVRSREDRLWRLELDRTAADRGGVLQAFERFVDSLRPVPPEPAGGAVRSNRS